MKIGKIVLVAFLVMFLGYLLYLGIVMSYSYPAIKEYYFDVKKDSFEEKLTFRIDSSSGWSLEKEDTVKGVDEVCYWASLYYEENGQKLAYDIKYCLDSKTSSGGCIRLEIVDVIDYIKKSSRRKLSDKEVEKLLQILDSTILNELAPACSRNP